jgi:hypothetical protein
MAPVWGEGRFQPIGQVGGEILLKNFRPFVIYHTDFEFKPKFKIQIVSACKIKYKSTHQHKRKFMQRHECNRQNYLLK